MLLRNRVPGVPSRLLGRPGRLGRVGAAVLSAGLLVVGAPLLGATPALAAAPAAGPSRLSFPGLDSQSPARFSTDSDGANTTVTLLADSTVPGPGYSPVAQVRFFQADNNVTNNPTFARTLVGTATMQPWTIQFTPSAATYLSASRQTIYAVSYDIAGTVIDEASVSGWFSGGAAVSVNGPTATTIAPNNSGNYTVFGTRSASNPALFAQFWLRDNASGVEGPKSATQSNLARGGWSFTSSGLSCPNTAPSGCDLMFSVLASANSTDPAVANGPSDQHQWRIRSYTQTATSVVVTPPLVSVLPGTPVNFVATTLDQLGAPMAGHFTNLAMYDLPVTTSPGAYGYGNYDGQWLFTVKASAGGTTTITPYDPGLQVTSAKYHTVTVGAPPLSVLPGKSLYASTSPVSEYSGLTPALQQCFTLSDGSPISSTSVAMTSRLYLTQTRTTKVGATSTTAAPVLSSYLVPQGDAAPCVALQRAGSGSEEEGSDTFTGYIDNDNDGGYQTGGADVVLTPVTLRWGQLQIAGSTTTSTTTSAQATFTSTTPDGQPFVGRSLSLAVTSPTTSTLTVNQPAGTTYLSATTATCLTDATGSCSVSLTNPAGGMALVTAVDDRSTPTQSASRATGSAQVLFSAAAATAPTTGPTIAPTTGPTAAPTTAPTAAPTAVPTSGPTTVPTSLPTTTPSAVPTGVPSTGPTPAPTAVPTPAPTAAPTSVPTVTPTPVPTAAPTAAPTVTATPNPTAVPTSAPASAVTLNGGNAQNPAYGSTYVVSGTAQPGVIVTLFVHKAGTSASDYTIQLTTIAAGGVWAFPLLATSDYRYYAAAGGDPTGSVLFQPTATLGGPLTVTVAKNQPYTLRGNAPAGAIVYLHFHQQGTAADDYSIVRQAVADSLGNWQRSYLAALDYRVYVSRAIDDSSAGQVTSLVQAR